MAADSPIITRFAPSPTGLLHVGGARTALFAWAYARGHQGKFILRLEDTDQKRSSDAAAESILADLKWLGIDWDEGPYRQSERLNLYNGQVAKLLEAGVAYEDEGAVRFRMDRDMAFDDAVYGHIAVNQSELEDFVVKKADGFPTFHLAVVVDDALMGVTHVIRGQEHLSNTTKHAALYDALGFDRPTWVHTPSIMNPDGSKMSKRDKAKVARAAAEAAGLTDGRYQAFLDKENDDLDTATAIAAELNIQLPEINVADFRCSGYLPGVLCNYIALLGWNPGNDVERFDTDFLQQHFNFDRIGKANSKFDRTKLSAFNGDTLQPPEFSERFVNKLRAHMEQYHVEFMTAIGDHFDTFAAMYQPRCKTLNDPVVLGHFFIEAPAAYDAKAVKKNLLKNDNEGLNILQTFRGVLDALESWDGESLQAAIEQFTSEKGLKNMGSVAQPLRVAMTGSAVSPPIDQTLAVLGRDEVLGRIDRCARECST